MQDTKTEEATTPNEILSAPPQVKPAVEPTADQLGTQETEKLTKEADWNPSEDLEITNFKTKPPKRETVDPTYRGWKEVGGWTNEPLDLDNSQLSQTTFLDLYLPSVAYGDWYHNAGLLVVAGFLSWLLGKLKFSVGPLFVVTLVSSVIYRSSIKKYRASIRKEAQREFSIKKIENDYETMDWLNNFLHKFWYFLEPSVAQLVCEQVNPILASSPAPAFIKSLWIDSFTAGSKPPRIDCVKALQGTKDDVVIMDWGFSFTPNSIEDITLDQMRRKVNQNVTVKAKLFGLTIPVSVSNVQVRALARVRLRMMPSFPHIETVNVSLLEPPEFDFTARLLGDTVFNWEILNFPGLYPLINEMIKKYAGPLVFAPLSFQLNIQQLMSGNPFNSAIGVLMIKAKSARGLKGFKFVGNTVDPYLTFSFLKEALAKSSVKKDTTQPVWDETFYIPIQSFSEPLNITVTDYNEFRKDKELGAIQFDLEKLIEKPEQPNISLPFIRNNVAVGELQFGLKYFPTIDQKRHVDGSITPPPDLNTGIARISVEEARNLKGEGKGASTYVEVYVDDEKLFTSSTVKNSNSPKWGKFAEKIVFNRAKSKVKFLLMDSKSQSVLSKFSTALNEVLDATSVDETWFPLKTGGEVRLMAKWKPVGLGTASGSSGYTFPKGVVRISMYGAEDLRNLERVGKIDPYARILVNGFQRCRTATKESTLNPVWNEVLYVPVSSANQRLTLEVFDVEKLSPDRTLGSFDVKLNELISKDENGAYMEFRDTERRESRLVHRKGPKGTLSYSLSFFPTLPVMSLQEIKEEEDERRAEQKKAQAEADAAKNEKKDKKADVKEEEVSEDSEVESDSEFSGKRKLALPELLEYTSGVLAYNIVDISTSKNDVYLQAYFDNHGEADFTSAKIKKNKERIGITGDTVIKELDDSIAHFRLTKDDDDNRADSPVSEVTLHTRDLLKDSYSGLYELNLTGAAKATIRLQCSWIPILYNGSIPIQDSFKNSGIVYIQVVRAEGLKASDRNGKSDPYVNLYLNSDKNSFFKSKKVKKTLSPTWNEKCEVQVYNIYDSVVRVECKDWDIGPEQDDFLGTGELKLRELFEQSESEEIEVQLEGENSEAAGTVFFKLSYKPSYVLNVKSKSSSSIGDPLSAGLGFGKGVGELGIGVGKGVGKGVGTGVGGVSKGVGKALKRGLHMDKA